MEPIAALRVIRNVFKIMKSKRTIPFIIILVALLSSCSTKTAQPPTPLDRAINELIFANEIRIWTNLGTDGFCDEKGYSPPIKDKRIIKQLAKWIKSKPYEYDDKSTQALREGNVFGSLAVSVIFPDNSSITIVGSGLFCGTPVTAYTVPDDEYYEIEEVLRISGYKEK